MQLAVGSFAAEADGEGNNSTAWTRSKAVLESKIAPILNALKNGACEFSHRNKIEGVYSLIHFSVAAVRCSPVKLWLKRDFMNTLLVLQMQNVFVLSGTPEHTFVQPVEYTNLLVAL